MFHQADLLHTAHQILILKEYSPKSHLFQNTSLVAMSLSSRYNLNSRLHVKLEVFVKKGFFFTFNHLKIYTSNFNKLIVLR